MTVEQVQQEVRRFWQAFSANDAQGLSSFYSSSATVFNSTGSQPEPGPLGAARCYFDFDFSLVLEVGDIQVQFLDPDAGSAVASYTLRLRRDLVRDMQINAPEVTDLQMDDLQINDPQVNDPLQIEESLIEYGRVSQVFSESADGKLCIVHEHLSLPEVRRWEKMERKALIELVRVPA